MQPQLGKIVTLGFLSYIFTFAYGIPTVNPFATFLSGDPNITLSSGDYENTAFTKRQEPAKVALRILSLGASTVAGETANTNSQLNGFRKGLRDALRFNGWDVNMVGSRESGTMQDRDHEGTGGFTLSQIRTAYQNSKDFKPNIVVMNAGTNDASQEIDIDRAGARLELILNDIWASPGMDRTCVFVSTLLQTSAFPASKNRTPMNGQYRALVKKRFTEGRCIYLAEMDGVGPAQDFIKSGVDVPPNDVHPNDDGYKKMAAVFFEAIKQAHKAGKIFAAAAPGTIAPNGCPKEPLTGIYAGSLTQKGSGDDDGIYQHSSDDAGTILSIVSDVDKGQFFFARLYGNGRDDLLEWFEHSGGAYMFGVWKNFGGGKLTKISDLFPDLRCGIVGVQFIDMNADGYDDFVCVGPEGELYLAMNQKDGTDSRPPTFKRVSTTAMIKEPAGFKQSQVRLADIDGDGRGDYGIVESDGSVHFWRNGWVDDIPQYWQQLGKKFDGALLNIPSNRVSGIRFTDINGDGRDDLLYVESGGRTVTWTNARSCAEGVPGNGLHVSWRQGFQLGATSGPTHFGPGGGISLDRIKFARIYGQGQDFGLSSRKDYVVLEHTTLSSGKHSFNLHVWKTKGFGATKLKADGNKYCNVMGNQGGAEDYVWTFSKGQMTLFPNAGKTRISGDESWWKVSSVIWDPYATVGRDLDRRDLHLVDYDGDGYCDIVWTDPDRNNRISVWINKYKTVRAWDKVNSWTYIADPAPALQCNQRRSISGDIHDLAVRFADITGNGRGDYMCLQKNGVVTGFIQRDDGSWENVGQIKAEDGKDRANLRWADVNGDGKDDLLWIEKFSGNGHVWYNNGRVADTAGNAGSSFRWLKIDQPVFDANKAGTCMYFPDLDGNGRADMHAIRGTYYNEAETWLSPSCGLKDRTGDDPGGVVDPKLPVPPNSTSPAPGDSTDPDDWTKVSCSSAAVTNAADPGADRWRLAKAPAAWAAAKRSWEFDQTLAFPAAVANFFHLGDQMDCHSLVDSNGCDTIQQCSQNWAAGFMIANSFVKINQILWNFYSALERANNDIANAMPDFAARFAPLPPQGLTVAQILDIFLLGYGAMAAPMWNKALKGVPFTPNSEGNYNTLKDFTNDMVSNSITTTKDFITNNKDLQATTNGLTEQMRVLVGSWGKATVDFAATLHNGAASNVDRLGAMISDGKFFDRRLTPLDVEAGKAEVARALYGLLIPHAWRTASAELNPFVIDSMMTCAKAEKDDDDETTGEGITRWVNGRNISRVCYQDRAYYLVMARDPGIYCYDRANSRGCDKFEPAQGIHDLNSIRWGMVTREDLVFGSVNTFRANGEKNQVKPTNFVLGEGGETITAIQELNIIAPGYISLPICRVKEARANYFAALGQARKDRVYHFPCNVAIDRS